MENNNIDNKKNIIAKMNDFKKKTKVKYKKYKKNMCFEINLAQEYIKNNKLNGTYVEYLLGIMKMNLIIFKEEEETLNELFKIFDDLFKDAITYDEFI